MIPFPEKNTALYAQILRGVTKTSDATVTPPVPAALVRANLPEMCTGVSA